MVDRSWTIPSLTGACGVPPNAGNYDACARTNAVTSAAPASWNFVPKSGTPGTFPPQSFFEGGVNLNAIFGAGNVPCFSSFLAETRSSSSITAQLKDFAEGSFDLCKITVTKNCNFVGVINGGTKLQVHLQRHGHEQRRRDRLRCAGGGYPRECYRYDDSTKSDTGRCQPCPRSLRDCGQPHLIPPPSCSRTRHWHGLHLHRVEPRPLRIRLLRPAKAP